ncbi:MAG TPA: DUF4157 domain-containing protein [Pirellulales bacterium]|jgi:hypothetical protein|nr:DUF4157 domain-containing protein [Pirellulales bacterium]
MRDRVTPIAGRLVEQNSGNGQALPGSLRHQVESLSGFSLNDVRVHYNSPLPTHLNALAYTQGTNIHVAPGHEHHLPHEAWHVVQQRQPGTQMKPLAEGLAENGDSTLESESDVPGTDAVQA